MKCYELSWRATGNAHSLIDSYDDHDAQHSWCFVKITTPRRFLWVSYSDHQLTRGFIRTHHISNFIKKGKLDSEKLPLGVASSKQDNHIFWKNVARTELLLMHVAIHRIEQLMFSNLSTDDRIHKQTALRQLQKTHYRNFKTSQLCCRKQTGLLTNYSSHPAWLHFQKSLPASEISNTIKTTYLSKRIARFDQSSSHSFRFMMPVQATDATVQRMESYLNLVMCEHVLMESGRGNFIPAIQYQLCFPVASRSLYLASQHYLK